MADLANHPGYSIEPDGTVYSHRRRFGLGKGKGGGVTIDPTFRKKLEHFPGHGGYPYVSMHTDRGQRSIPIHVLLAEAFIGPRPDGLEVRHLDGNCRNYALDNLAYGTPKQNAADRLRCGKAMQGEEHPRAKLTAEQVREIRRRLPNETRRALAREFNISKSALRDIATGRRWAIV